MTNPYLALAVAILAEVVATSCLKASDSFTRLWPSIATVVGYVIAFYCLSLSLRTIPIGIAYAVWSGIGIVLISLVGWVAFGQHLDLPAILGIALIIVGVTVVNLFSKSLSH